MAEGIRDRMAVGAAELLARHGPQATSFSEVLAHTGAPRGSVYHHFPGGKDELVGAAIEVTATRAQELLESMRGAPAVDVAEYFLEIWRTLLTRTDFRVGCALVAVTTAADSDDLVDLAAGAFRSWRARLAELLAVGGLGPDRADRVAVLLLAASEGAVVLSRAERSIEPFDTVAADLLDLVRAG